MERETIESQLFSWETWDSNGPGDLQFGDVTLKVQIGEFPVGAKLPAAFWVGTAALLILMDTQDQEHVFELKISVGARVDAAEFARDACAPDCGCGHEHS